MLKWLLTKPHLWGLLKVLGLVLIGVLLAKLWPQNVIVRAAEQYIENSTGIQIDLPPIEDTAPTPLE